MYFHDNQANSSTDEDHLIGSKAQEQPLNVPCGEIIF